MSKRKKERAARVSWAQQMRDQVTDLTFELARERRAHHDARAVAFRAATAMGLPAVHGDEHGVVDMPGLGAAPRMDTLFLHAPTNPRAAFIDQTMSVVAIKLKVLKARLPCGIILRWAVPDEESLR